jgi:peptidoglycan/LPS O-acetylase OafA/YrhL
LSGYVLSIRFFSAGDTESPVSGMLKRYVRLVIPITGSILLSYLILLAHGYCNTEIGNTYTYNTFWYASMFHAEPSIFNVFKEGFVDTLFAGGGIKSNPVLWTMNIEYIGSVIVFAMLALFGKIKNRWIIYLILASFVFQTYFLAFIIGVALCDYRFGKYFRRIPIYITAPLLLIGLYVGSFHYITLKPGSAWGYVESSKTEQNELFYILAASLILFSIIHEKLFQRVLSTKVLRFFGKISFSFYLLHVLVLGSFTGIVFRYCFVDMCLNYHLSFLIAFFTSLGLLLVVSNYYHKFVDVNAIRLSGSIYRRFFKKD